MYQLEFDIDIDRPIDVVFRNASCLRGCVNWSSALQQAEELSKVEGHIGSRYKQTANFMGLTTTSIKTITLWDEPHQFASTDNESRHKYTSHYTLTERPQGTHVHVKMYGTIDPSLMGRIAEPVLVRGMKRQVQHDLETLKEMLENDVTVHV